MPLGMNLFLCLFLTPFILVGAGLFFALLLSVAGRVEVVVSGPDGRVRTGVGPFRWTRRFAADQSAESRPATPPTRRTGSQRSSSRSRRRTGR